MSTNTSAPRGKRRWLSILGVALLPVLLVATLVASVWQANDRNHTVRAAIVNLDEPVTIEGQYVPLGRQFAGTLSSLEDVPGASGEDADRRNYDWSVTNAEDAADGLRTGRYAAVVTIPENFSAAATSTAGDADQAEQAVVDVQVSSGATADPAFARSVVQAAINALNTDLTETFLDNVFVGFTTMGKQFATIADAADQLADGTHELSGGLDEVSSGATELDKGMQQLDKSGGTLATGVQQYTGGVTSLAEGLRQLQQGTAQLPAQTKKLADGADQTADGAQELAKGAKGLAGGATQLQGGIEQTGAGAKELANGAQQTADGTKQLGGAAKQVADGAQGVAGGLDEYNKTMQGLAASVAKNPMDPDNPLSCVNQGYADPVQCAAYIKGLGVAGGVTKTAMEGGADGQPGLLAGAKGVSQGATGIAGGLNGTSGKPGLVQGTAGIAKGTKQLSAGINGAKGKPGLAQGAKQLAGGATQLSDGAGALAGGARQLADGAQQFSAAMPQLANGIKGAADGATTLSSSGSELASGVTQYTEGVGKVAEGTGPLADGLGQLANGARQLDDGQRQLADGLAKGKSQVPSYTDSERQQLTTVATRPVTTGSESGPLAFADPATLSAIAGIALWLGALLGSVLLGTGAAQAWRSAAPSWRLMLGRLLPLAGIAAGQGMVFGATIGWLTGVVAGDVVQLVLIGGVAGLAFAATNQGLGLLAGRVGRFIAVAVGILASAAAIAPSLPPFLAALRPVLPTTPAIDAFTAVTGPTPGLGWNVAAVVVWLIGGLALAWWGLHRHRQVKVIGLVPAPAHAG